MHHIHVNQDIPVHITELFILSVLKKYECLLGTTVKVTSPTSIILYRYIDDHRLELVDEISR
ncbi:hypothetical protein J31TS4_18930 [Paenibacillus sp. J31TS4]|nr:hypothetical protein J31TS4_18930 [Paenibacillus sp. J31TS4]